MSVLRRFSSLVKLGHTVFGLPFTFAAAALAHRHAQSIGLDGLTVLKLVWIAVAFTGARTFAMGFNRIVDRDIDAENPRTKDRELPSGQISLRAAGLLTALAGVCFVGAATMLGPIPLLLSPVCLVVLGSYSFFKRFSWSSHLVLGVALSLGPIGAWVAVTGSLLGMTTPVLLASAVATWVAGFDVIYSLQDEAFDTKTGLHSIPVTFGTRGALIISALLHVATMVALGAMHYTAGLGPWHIVGMATVGVILAYEHWIVRPHDLSRIGKAFFDLNGYVSIAYFACVLVQVWVDGRL